MAYPHLMDRGKWTLWVLQVRERGMILIEGELGTFITSRGGAPPDGYAAPECQFVLRLDGREAMQHLRANSFRLYVLLDENACKCGTR